MGQVQGKGITSVKNMTSKKGADMDYDTVAVGEEEMFPIPHEVFLHILAFLSASDLIHRCRLVNKTWQSVVDSSHLWLTKMKREDIMCLPDPEMIEYEFDYRKVYVQRPFGRNLLKNWDGSGGLRDWDVTENGGNRFRMEPADKPAGSHPLPKELGCQQCWATSYGRCSKNQVVDLVRVGCEPKWLDNRQPPIEVSVWVANRHDCASVYTLSVGLCDKNGSVIKNDVAVFRHERRRPQWDDNKWEKIAHTFTSYGKGVRFVTFQHSGVDGQFWAGHYGSKMAAPSVKILPTDGH